MSNFKVCGIDTGSLETGYSIVIDNKDSNKYVFEQAFKVENNAFITILKSLIKRNAIDEVAIESVQSYGAAFGKTTIDTIMFIGRIVQVCIDLEIPYHLYPRPEYGKAVVGGNKVSDTLIRAALENRFGSYSKGKKEKVNKKGIVIQAGTSDGPLVKLIGANDLRSAASVAVYRLDLRKYEVNNKNV